MKIGRWLRNLTRVAGPFGKLVEGHTTMLLCFRIENRTRVTFWCPDWCSVFVCVTGQVGIELSRV